MESTIQIKWLEGKPACKTGVTFGVCFHKGELTKGQPVGLFTESGEQIPIQFWPTAYWPDGSIKWLGVAAVLSPEDGDKFEMRIAENIPPKYPITIDEIGIEIFLRISTGEVTWDVGDRGIYLLQQVKRDGRICAGGVKLCGFLERRDQGEGVRVRESFTGLIKKMIVEQRGPIRSVIKIEGTHRVDKSRREWLPFVLRFYFYAGVDQVEVVHSVVYDGDPGQDFIAGLGIEAMVPLTAAYHDRHIRFSREDQPVWIEPVKYFKNFNHSEWKEKPQVLGQPVQEVPEGSEMLPLWSDFQLCQDYDDRYLIRKRLGDYGCWVDAAHGKRASGMVTLSDSSGGLGISVKTFWQSYPTMLEVEGAAGGDSRLRAWFYSPEARALDLRHYGNRDYRDVYEAVNPDPDQYSSAYGIGRTSRFSLWAMTGSTTNGTVDQKAILNQAQNRLVCTSEHYYDCQTLGIWGLPDKQKGEIDRAERRLTEIVDYYLGQIEQRKWYGFLHYGDVMHAFDGARKTWCYDLGGHAWDNDELMPNLFFWYMALRTGRADIFRMAEALTQHVGDVDTYHLGKFKHIGTRHNVVHYGCPCKEPRIGMAPSKRILYFLTCDDHIGDLLDAALEADLVQATNEPTDGSKVARISPVWSAYVSNLMTAWERRGDQRYLDKINTGIDGIFQAPYRLVSVNPFYYDARTGAMTYSEDYHFYSNGFMGCFAAPEVFIELAELTQNKKLIEMIEEYSTLHAMERSEIDKITDEGMKRRVLTQYERNVEPRMAAWTAARRSDTHMAEKAYEMRDIRWGAFFAESEEEKVQGSGNPPAPFSKMYPEAMNFTNAAAQWGLETIALLRFRLKPEKLEKG